MISPRPSRETLSGLPIDLMRRGCETARVTCRFASEIVPCIHAQVGKEWERRKRVQAEEKARAANPSPPQIATPYVTFNDARQIIAETLRGWSA